MGWIEFMLLDGTDHVVSLTVYVIDFLIGSGERIKFFWNMIHDISS